MFKIDVNLHGLDNVFNKLNKLGKLSDTVVQETVTDVVLNTHEHAVMGIQFKTGGGKAYKKYKPKRIHRASGAGSYPNSDTGALVGSIKPTIPIKKPFKGIVSVGIKYGRMLEFGTSKMGARPFLQPSFKRAVKNVKKILKRRFNV